MNGQTNLRIVVIDQVQVDAMFSHENERTLKLYLIEVPPHAGQDEGSWGDGLQVPPRHLKDESSIVGYYGDDL